jgi:Contractile injection system tape measure protein
MPGELELTADECGEAASLLENVVQRWEKLGNSSIAGLREGFLQRPGKLFDKGGRLYLQLEASGVDVLLDYLPWGLSIVKLPWLAEPIFVEWR